MNEQCFVNEVQASFNLRQPKANKPTNIYLVCRIQGKQVKLSTGVKIYPEHWNRQKQEAYTSFRLSELDNRNNETANSRINELRGCFSAYKQYLCNNPERITDSLSILREFIYKDNPNMKKGKQQPNATLVMKQLIEGKQIADNSKSIEIGIVNKFADFLKNNSIPDTWDSMNLDTLNRYQEYRIKNVKGNVYKTISNNLKGIIRILKLANKRIDIPFKWANSNLDSFEIIKNRANKDLEKDKQVALTEEQVIQIYEYQPTGKNADKDTEIKDLFVLQCLVGQRIGDMPKFFNGYYTLDEDTNTISFPQQKRKDATAIIPLLPLAKEILNRYKEGLKSIVIGRSGNLIINRTIRRIAKEVGLTDIVKYQTQKGDTVVDEEKPLYELIHTHTARHTFVTIMCRMGIPKETVIIATGHADVTMIDEVYEHLNKKDKANKITSAFSELKGDIFNMGNSKQVEPETQSNKSTSKSTSKPKPKVKILDYLFAESVLLRLDEMNSNDIDIYKIPETSKAIKIVKDISTIDKAKAFLDSIDKMQLYNRISKLSDILWYISAHYNDTDLYQIFEQKVIELGLSNTITKVTNSDILGQAWFQEYSD